MEIVKGYSYRIETKNKIFSNAKVVDISDKSKNILEMQEESILIVIPGKMTDIFISDIISIKHIPKWYDIFNLKSEILKIELGENKC